MGKTGAFVNQSEVGDWDSGIRQLAAAVILRLIYDLKMEKLSINGGSPEYKKKRIFYAATEYPLRYTDELNFWLSLADMEEYADTITDMAKQNFKRGYVN